MSSSMRPSQKVSGNIFGHCVTTIHVSVITLVFSINLCLPQLVEDLFSTAGCLIRCREWNVNGKQVVNLNWDGIHMILGMLQVVLSDASIVCQMLSWQTKNSSHFINIWDTVTNVVPLHSVHQAQSYEPILTLLAWFLQDLAYLSMLFILEVLCTACRIITCSNKPTLWVMVLEMWE